MAESSNQASPYRFHEDRMRGEYMTPDIIPEIINHFVNYFHPGKVGNVLITYPKVDTFKFLDTDKLKDANISLLPAFGAVNANDFEKLKIPKQTKVYGFENESEIQQIIEDFDELDLVISTPPFGYNRKLRIKLDGNAIGRKDDVLLSRLNITEGIFLLSLQKLAKDGHAFIVVPNYVYFSSGFAETLDAFGMHIKFNIVLPDSTFRPYTAIQTNLLCIGAGSQDKPMLVSKLDDTANKEAMIKDITDYLEKGKTKLGDEVNPAQFSGYYAFEKQKVVDKQIVKSGYPLTNIMSDKFLEELAAIKENETDIATNSVYIPKIGKSPVLINLSDSKLRNPKNYYRATFKEDAPINNEYVANYLNSYVGLLIRESKFVASIIPSMRIGSLREEGLELPLPTLDEQEKIVKLHRELNAVTEQATEFQDKLWNFPASHKSINEEAKELIQKAPEDAWIEELPYPLASILKRYYNETDKNKQYSLLLHFFEALSELLTAIHLGAYVSNQELYENFKSNTEVGKKLASVISSSNFGGWILFLNDSNKYIKRGLSTKGDEEGLKNVILSAFGTTSEDYLQKLADSTITNILEKTVGLRNSTKGHGPYIDIPQSIHTSLVQLLSEIRKPLLAIFSNVSVITYDSSEPISESVIKYSVKVLRGSNPILPNKDIELGVSRILTKEYVYLYSSIEETIVKISSLVKMGALPDDKKIGFYFYNAKSKWKSYEFETEFESDDSVIFKELQL